MGFAPALTNNSAILKRMVIITSITIRRALYLNHPDFPQLPNICLRSSNTNGWMREFIHPIVPSEKVEVELDILRCRYGLKCNKMTAK